ncbi:MAG: efflux RND transporter periplasmic adaptor subunit [Polymorphobacter sp.]
MTMRKLQSTGLVLAALLALAACGEKSAPPAAPVAAPAGTQLKLAPTTIADMKAVGAEITTRDLAEARVRIPGTLASLEVRAGDSVGKGQRIATVVDARLGFESGAAAALLAAAEAAAVRARADLGRIDDLYRNKVYAKARLDSAVATSRAADARVAAARAQANASASVAGQGAVLAPASGRVLRADVPAGSVVVPGMSVATITAGPPVVRLELPESLAGHLRPGAPVTLTDSDLPGVARSGRVIEVYPAISAGRVTADAQFSGLSQAFVGRRVSTSIAIGERRALVVPRRFVETRYGIDYVTLLAADNQASAVPVQTAPVADAAMVELLSGVAAGDTLIARGAAK